MKKKSFIISKSNLTMWSKLVQKALLNSDSVKFNILYQNIEFKNILDSFGNNVHVGEYNNKFYYTGNVLSISLEDRKNKIFEYLTDFIYWKNKCIEDPSFWIRGNEILACITHENLVVVDLEYFGNLIGDLDLYDLP